MTEIKQSRADNRPHHTWTYPADSAQNPPTQNKNATGMISSDAEETLLLSKIDFFGFFSSQ